MFPNQAVDGTPLPLTDILGAMGSTLRNADDWPSRAIRSALLLIIMGIALRVPLYIANRSLWTDEASLADNLIDRSFKKLCQPLDFEQGAPIGFLFAERTMVLALGPSEFSLRLIPLLSSIVSLWLCFLIVRRWFDPVTGLIALGMMALSKSSIQYSVELKQYSSDTTATLAIVLLAMRALSAEVGGTSRRQKFAVVWFGLIGAILDRKSVV